MVGRREYDVWVEGLIWDYSPGGNIEHIAEHAVTREDVEEVALHSPRFFRNLPTGGASHLIVGPNREGRFMRVAITESEQVGKWLVITAHWLSRRRGERLYDSE